MDKCAYCRGSIDREKYPRAIYCSGQCRQRHYHHNKWAQTKENIPDITKVCPECGEKWTRKATEAHRRIYCSTECARKAQGRIQAEIRADRQLSKPKMAICRQCGVEYKQKINSVNRLYCSAICKRKANSTIESTCTRCGVKYKHSKQEKGKLCSVQCFHESESKKWAEIRYRKKKAMMERKVAFDAESRKRLAVFLETNSNAETARMFNEPESTTHGYLKTIPEYIAIQKKRSKNSKWKRDGVNRGMISTLYKMESHFCDDLEAIIKKAGFDYFRECKVPGESRRKADFVIRSIFGTYVIEAKNTNHTSDLDCAIGQAMVRSLPFNGIPVVAFPSDLSIDPVAVNAARSYGVRIVTEKTITAEIA